MEFRDTCKDDEVRAAGDEYPDSITRRVDDEEEELSLCDLVIERADLKSCGLNGESSVKKEDFRFELDLDGCKSMAFGISPADDLFHQGRLLPLNNKSNTHFSYGKQTICHEKRRLLNEKMQAWRRDSLELQSSNFPHFNPPYSQALQKQAVYSVSGKELKQGNCASKPPTSVSKICFKWQQIFGMGLMKMPPMKVEDMHPKQRKPNNNGLERSFVKRAVSCNCDRHTERSAMVAKNKRRVLNFQQKSQSVRENLKVKKTDTQSRWWMLGPLKSFNSCRFSSNSVMDCLSGVGKTPAKMLSVKANQNSLNLAQGSVKLTTSEHFQGIKVDPP